MAPEKRLLVLVNPHSGQGLSKTIFERQVKPVFYDKHIDYRTVTTEYPGHARKIVETIDISDLGGIVVVSGDGLIYEVYNGLYSRTDWSEAIRLPIGAIPAGSGNGLAKSISYFSNKPYDDDPPLISAKTVASGRPTPMDLVFIETSSGRSLVSFLSIGWGIMADIDIESERLRMLGEIRFSLWALVRVINLKHYDGKLYFLPADKSHLKRNRLRRSQTDIPVGRCTGSVCDLGSLSSCDSFGCPSAPSTSGDNPRKGMKLLPPLDKPVPNTFQCLEGSFLSVYAVYQPFINTCSMFAPESEMNDGLIWLSVVRKGASRYQVSQFLLALNSNEGTHRELPFVDFYPVTAFRLEPLSNNSYITVDGETIDYGPMQAEVGSGAGSVITHT